MKVFHTCCTFVPDTERMCAGSLYKGRVFLEQSARVLYAENTLYRVPARLRLAPALGWRLR
jgi:hypothetical protein